MEESVHPGDESGIEQIDPPEVLRRAIAAVASGWLVRCVERGAQRGGATIDQAMLDDARDMAGRETPRLLERVSELLATDVDAQRTNPLAVFRSAVIHPNGVLDRHAVPTPGRAEWDRQAFPDDVYDLGPATWADIHESLVEPGLVWGAWKAATVLRRRRGEGLR